MKITCTKPNAKNKLKGSRITVKNDKKEIIDQFLVQKYDAIKYCKDHPKGEYGKRFADAAEKASKGEL